jgi:phage-related protein (TIGR01555 family)
MARSPATKKLPVRDGFVNLVNNLGSTKDPRMATSYSFVPMSSEQLITAYRSNWLAGRIVDAFAEDATREWRSWQASDEQIQAIEDEERKHNLQKKVRQALIRARLFGGAALVMGVDGTGNVSEPLDLDDVTEGALKFIIPLSNIEISRGQLIVDVTSPWFGRPEYYRINTGRADLSDVDNSAFTDIHPSRVVEFVGREIPDWNIINGTTTWGDSVLQIVDDVLKDYGMSLSAIAAMINDCKVDIFTIPGLTKHISNPDYERRLTTRLTVSNTMKSTINAMLMDENEKHERIQTTFSGLPQIMSELLKVVAGAAGIPMTRLVGHGSGSGKSTLGNGPMEEAQIALSKAQTFTADVTAGLINPDVLRKIRINQLTEDATYPGIEDAIEEFGEEPDEPSIGPEDVQAHLSMLQSSSQQLQQIGKAAQPAAALPAPKPEPTTDAHPLENLRMFGR